MPSLWMKIVVLVLLASLSGAQGNLRTETSTGNALDDASVDTIIEESPHTIARLATDREVLGVWYPLEVIWLTNSTVDYGNSCWQCNISINDDSLSVHYKMFQSGIELRSYNGMYSRGANNTWHSQGPSGFMGISPNDKFLVVWQIRGTRWGSLLSRTSDVSAAELRAARRDPNSLASPLKLENCPAPSVAND